MAPGRQVGPGRGGGLGWPRHPRGVATGSDRTDLSGVGWPDLAAIGLRGDYRDDRRASEPGRAEVRDAGGPWGWGEAWDQGEYSSGRDLRLDAEPPAALQGLGGAVLGAAGGAGGPIGRQGEASAVRGSAEVHKGLGWPE